MELPHPNGRYLMARGPRNVGAVGRVVSAPCRCPAQQTSSSRTLGSRALSRRSSHRARPHLHQACDTFTSLSDVTAGAAMVAVPLLFWADVLASPDPRLLDLDLNAPAGAACDGRSKGRVVMFLAAAVVGIAAIRRLGSARSTTARPRRSRSIARSRSCGSDRPLSGRRCHPSRRAWRPVPSPL